MRRMRKFAIRTATAAIAVVGLRALFGPETKGRKALRRSGDRLTRDLRYWGGRWDGVSYRLLGRRPYPWVADDVLADRIRSSLGRLEARLDLPHVHVMVEDHIALLHGDVASAEDAVRIEKATTAVSGVLGVESFLHIGLISGDTRPSEGRSFHTSSEAFCRLLAAVTDMGIDDRKARTVVWAVLSAFVERLPEGERAHVIAHLPADVRELALAPRRVGAPVSRVRTVPELVATVIAGGDVPTERAVEAVEAVVRVLRDLIPEESEDVSAVLPEELRQLWQGASA